MPSHGMFWRANLALWPLRLFRVASRGNPPLVPLDAGAHDAVAPHLQEQQGKVRGWVRAG